MRLFNLMVGMLLATLLSLITFSLAKAEKSLPTLKQFVVVASDIVTLGDLFHGSGLHAETAVFRAPALNTSGEVSAHQVALAARRAGLSALDLAGVDQVIVRREAQLLDSEAFAMFLAGAISQRTGSEAQFQISFQGSIPTLPATTRGQPIHLDALSTQRTNASSAINFEAHLSIDQGERDQRLVLRGQAIEMVSVYGLTRNLGRGETISNEDITLLNVQRTAGRRDGLTDRKMVLGKVTTRPLRNGHILRAQDITVPNAVRRNDPVRIIYERGPLTVMAEGQALQSGPIGATIAVLNRASKRRVEGKVLRPGFVTLSDMRLAGSSMANGPVPGTTNTPARDAQ